MNAYLYLFRSIPSESVAYHEKYTNYYNEKIDVVWTNPSHSHVNLPSRNYEPKASEQIEARVWKMIDVLRPILCTQ